VDRPELAKLSEGTKKLLKVIMRCHDITLGIISGRALNDLKGRVGLKGLIYVGNHGLEMEGPGLRFINPSAEEVRPELRLLNQVLSKSLGTIKGAFVEDKGLSLSVHYRQVEEGRGDEVGDIFEQVVSSARAEGKIRTALGKKVYEVRPAVSCDKGKAIELLIKQYGKGDNNEELLPIFLGDDLTDEDGFNVIENYGGISIFVGEEGADSGAHYFVRSPTEVEKFMEMLIELKTRL
jgi:trehalose 6-phosphate phosphatase